MKTSWHSSLEKYASHFIDRVVCERELETEQNCNLLIPTRMAITAFLFCSLGLLNRGPGGPASLEHGPHSSIFYPTPPELQLLNRGSWEPLLGAGSLYSILSPTDWTSCAPNYIIVLGPLNSTCRQSRLSPWYLWPDAPVIYTGVFPILTARPGSICNKNSIPM